MLPPTNGSPTAAAVARKRVMIIDDAALMRMMISNIIKADARFEVVATCENGKVALEALAKAAPDVILVDLEMPVMDGLTFLRTARLKSRAKVVVLSSVAGPGAEKALEARRLGANAVLQKPSGAVSIDLAQKSGKRIIEALMTVTTKEGTHVV